MELQKAIKFLVCQILSALQKKKCRVSLDAPYSSVIAVLSQNESAELRISVLKILQVFVFGWIPVHHALSAECLQKGWACQVLGYAEDQDVANFSLPQLSEAEVKIGTAVLLCLLTTVPPMDCTNCSGFLILTYHDPNGTFQSKKRAWERVIWDIPEHLEL